MTKVEISTKTILFIAAFILGLWFLFQIRDLILILFVSIILVSALNPVVNRLTSFRIPRVLAILLVYILLILGFSGFVAVVIPPLVDQGGKLIIRFPVFLDQTSQFLGLGTGLIPTDPEVIARDLTSLTGGIFKATVNVFSDIISILTMFMITFYLLLERDKLEDYLVKFFSGAHRERMRRVIDRTEGKLGAWFRGQLVLMFLVGLMSYIGLKILGVEFALPLALIAGILEILPNVGPFIALIPAVIVAFVASPVLAIAVFALYFIIQQLENNLIVPQVMRRAVGLNPLVIILALMIGGRLFGIAGAILAVPAVVVIQIVVSDFLEYKKS